jgi:hypothetical protein
MGIILILFLIAAIMAFFMLSYRAWEIKTLRADPSISPRKLIPEMYFRHLEKIMLHLAKHIIQIIVLVVVRYWFILITKIKKWTAKKLPKVLELLKKKEQEVKNEQQKESFFRKAVLESKSKIKRIKETVRREHGEDVSH